MTLLLWLACTDKDPLADSGLDSDPIDTGSLDSDLPVDADGDGFDEDEDCDDDNDAVHPGADELCNMQDDDCDGAIDEDAVDADVGWFDADGDGYGAGDEVAGCALELVDNADDCNDDNDTVNPGADEVCDGVDNDCDEVGDGNAVPGDFATLQDAGWVVNIFSDYDHAHWTFHNRGQRAWLSLDMYSDYDHPSITDLHFTDLWNVKIALEDVDPVVYSEAIEGGRRTHALYTARQEDADA